jgi:type I restriction enzyme M protein
MHDFSDKVSFIWSVADLIRGPYRPNQYKNVMLPLTILRRLDCVLEPNKDKVLQKAKSLQDSKVKNVDPLLCRVSGVPFYNTSRYDFEKLKGDPSNVAANLINYIKGFSGRAREIIEHFGFEEEIAKLEKANRLYLVVSKFAAINLHPDKVSNIEMGYIFEELIRRFNEASNEEAGDHFTPREVIRLMVNLLFMTDGDTLTTKRIIKTLYDPACGTGGMLSVAEEYVRELNPDATLEAFGQDYNPQAYAICGSDMMIKGQDIEHIAFGNSFTNDHFPNKRFDYMLANPPFGVEWKPEEDFIKKEHEEHGFAGRFGPGLPRINDGSLLFLLHMISKMKSVQDGGTRLAIVFNGSPLFSGTAGSGESEIRRWIIDNDWLEAIVALPDQLFYNTGISTYLWVVTNRKEQNRRGKVQLVDATSFFKKMRKSLGNKRNEICEDQRGDITGLYGALVDGDHVRIFDNQDFGYRRITIERPLRLNFAVSDDRITRLRLAAVFANLATSKKRKDTKAAEVDIEEGQKLQTAILGALRPIASKGVIKNRTAFVEELKNSFRDNGLKVPAPLFKGILEALSERDETADVCTDTNGNPEPDPDLRDYENLPLKVDVAGYMNREVLPHMTDAWVDESKTKIGYEINFNRYFYKCVRPRSLLEIQTELKQIDHDLTELQGKRSDTIAYATTKGINPTVRMKASGVDWLGDIPEHWTLKKLKHITKTYGGGTPSKFEEKYWQGDIPWVSPKDMGPEYIDDAEDHITEEAIRNSSTRLLQPNTVLIVVRSGILRHTLPVGINRVACALNQDMKAFVPHPSLLPGYLAYLIRGLQKAFLPIWKKSGTTVESLEHELILGTEIPIPPVEEQQAIIRLLDADRLTSQSLYEKIESSISCLHEFRTSLISAAVTGNICVSKEIAHGRELQRTRV